MASRLGRAFVVLMDLDDLDLPIVDVTPDARRQWGTLTTVDIDGTLHRQTSMISMKGLRRLGFDRGRPHRLLRLALRTRDLRR